MQKSQTYTISEAATLTGLHKNTIRQKVKLGQLEATVQPGKFGEEYRISHQALRKAGLLPADLMEGGSPVEPNGAVLEADFTPEPHEGRARPAGRGPEEAPVPEAVTALSELYQRHEQAMFRLGYLQGEMERLKALAETAESLQQDRADRERELESLRNALAEKERRAAEAEALTAELDTARRRLQEMEALRRDLEHLKAMTEQQDRLIEALETRRKRAWWRFW